MAYYVVIRERGAAWNWSLPMRRQTEWDAHAAFMDALVDKRIILAGGALGGEDDAKRVLHIVNAPEGPQRRQSRRFWPTTHGRR